MPSNSNALDMNDTYLRFYDTKDCLLKPLNKSYGSKIPLLLPEVTSSSTTTTKRYYGCSGVGCPDYVSENPYMDRPLTMISRGWHGYGKEAVAYMVTDDLEVKPLSVIWLSSISLKPMESQLWRRGSSIFAGMRQ